MPVIYASPFCFVLPFNDPNVNGFRNIIQLFSFSYLFTITRVVIPRCGDLRRNLSFRVYYTLCETFPRPNGSKNMSDVNPSKTKKKIFPFCLHYICSFHVPYKCVQLIDIYIPTMYGFFPTKHVFGVLCTHIYIYTLNSFINIFYSKTRNGKSSLGVCVYIDTGRM